METETNSTGDSPDCLAVEINEIEIIEIRISGASKPAEQRTVTVRRFAWTEEKIVLPMQALGESS